MASRGLDISDVVRSKAIAANSASWLDRLPDLVEELEARWSISVGDPYTSGTEAYVARAVREDGTLAVLKVLVPRNDGHDLAGGLTAGEMELTVLRLANGEGCAQLLEEDPANEAMLLERLGPALSDLQVPVGRRHEILVSAASALWRTAPDCGLPTGADKGRWLITHIERLWDELERPCARTVIDSAIACATTRITRHDDERAVLVHGDVHQWNTLQSGDGFKLVDPDGMLAEAEYDLGIIMREDPVELMTEGSWERAFRLADLSGMDATAIWEWGVVERVSTGLLCSAIGLTEEGQAMLRVAALVANGMV